MMPLRCNDQSLRCMDIKTPSTIKITLYKSRSLNSQTPPGIPRVVDDRNSKTQSIEIPESRRGAARRRRVGSHDRFLPKAGEWVCRLDAHHARCVQRPIDAPCE